MREIGREYSRIRPDDSGRLTAVYGARYFYKRMIRAIARLKTKLSVARVASTFPPSTYSLPSIAINVVGGLGDYIVVARFVRDLQSHSGPFRFSIFAQNTEAANWTFANLPGYDGAHSEFLFSEEFILENFALALSIHHTVEIIGAPQPSQMHGTLTEAITRIQQSSPVFGESKPNDHLIARHAVSMEKRRENFLHAMAAISYAGKFLDLPTDETASLRAGLSGKNYITINNGFDSNLIVSGDRSTKYYPHGDELVREFKRRYPEFLVVQVGARNSLPISCVDVQLIGKTSLQEVAGVLKRSKLHLDSEGGLVHLAQCWNVNCCVLFGPTPADYFAYEDNINIQPTFCGDCWWRTKTWMDICALGLTEPRCLSDISPAQVLERVRERLEKSV